MNDLISPGIEAYLEELVPARPPELARMEEYARESAFPIIGPAAGQFCYLVARFAGARRIFEMGSGFGYSTAWFARAVRENGGGEVYHVVWDGDLTQRAKRHLEALGLGNLITYRTQEAVSALRAAEGPFDLIFNDIDKSGYPASLEVIYEKLATGGALIIDNMLWSGRVLDPGDTTAATEGVREFTRRIRADERWSISLVPIRDGLIVARKNA